MTTIFVLLIAMLNKLSEDHVIDDGENKYPVESYREYLFFPSKKEDNYYKLLLSHTDRESFIKISRNEAVDSLPNSPLKICYETLCREIEKSKKAGEVDIIAKGLKNIKLLLLTLDPPADDPHAIFESLNSTGMALSQADLLRNYLFMRLKPADVDRLFKEYWAPMESLFDPKEFKGQFNMFVKSFLEVKKNSNIKNDELYVKFKDYIRETEKYYDLPHIMKDMVRFGSLYANLANFTYSDEDINKEVQDIIDIGYDSSFPFMIKLLLDYEDGLMTKPQLIEILDTLEWFFIRRMVCRISPSRIKKIMFEMFDRLDPNYYLASVQLFLRSLRNKDRFPNDEEFQQNFATVDLYDLPAKKMILLKLEGASNPKEKVDPASLTIEHVLPQNQNLSPEWQSQLGEGWEKKHQLLVHKVGNLTLTGYNSEMKDLPFEEKRKFLQYSSVNMNREISKYEKWGEKEIKERSEELARTAVRLWPSISGSISSSGLKQTQKSMDEGSFFMNSTEDVKEIYEQLKILVRGLDDRIKYSVQKDRITFRLKRKPILKTRPLKYKLRVWLTRDVRFEDEDDDDRPSVRKKYTDIESVSELDDYKSSLEESYMFVKRLLESK